MLSNDIQHFEISRSQLRWLAVIGNLEFDLKTIEFATLLIVRAEAVFGFPFDGVYVDAWSGDSTTFDQPVDDLVNEWLEWDIANIQDDIFKIGCEYEVWHVVDGKPDWMPLVYMTEGVLYQAYVETVEQSITYDATFYDCELARAGSFTEFMSEVYNINPYCAVELDYSLPTIPYSVAWEWESVWCDVYRYDMYPSISPDLAFIRSKKLFPKLVSIPAIDHYVGETFK